MNRPHAGVAESGHTRPVPQYSIMQCPEDNTIQLPQPRFIKDERLHVNTTTFTITMRRFVEIVKDALLRTHI